MLGVGIILGVQLSLAENYRVACGSQGNHIEFAVENGSKGAVANIRVDVVNAPSWLQVTSREQVLKEILPGKEATTNFYFAIDKSAIVGSAGTLTITITAAGERWNKAVDIEVTAPDRFALLQNYPNPFNPATMIEYTLPKQSKVSLKVFNVLGEEVRTLVDEFQDAGYKTVSFDANNLPSGMYFYRLQTGSFVDVKKMLMMK